MLTWHDCVALCALNDAEIKAIAAHEHVPAMAALALGHYLCRTPEGELAVERMILDDIEAARAKGDYRQLLVLLGALQHFVQTHPLAATGDKPAAS